MVATRALLDNGQVQEPGAELRRCLRDIVALSSLPGIWIRADAQQIASSLAQLIVSVLDADIARVVLGELSIDVIQSHDRVAEAASSIRHVPSRAWLSSNTRFDFDHATAGRLRGFSVPVGRGGASTLTALCRRPDFPTETEQLLLRIAASQATVSIQRWQNEQSLRAEIKQREQLEHRQVRLIEEQSALYRFTDTLYRAAKSEEIHEAALDAIIGALCCSRASILLFDEQGVMRFVAWRGLSEQYRAAVEGHSPWTRDTKDPDAICIASVEQAGIEHPLKQTIVDEGIAALSFVPLVGNGTVIGKFMAYYDVPHQFTAHEIEIAVTIARQLGFAIEQDRLRSAGRAAEHALRESEARKAAILASALDAIVAMDREGRIIDFNPAAERLFGYKRSDIIGQIMAETIVPERLRATHLAGLRAFLDASTGQVVGSRLEFTGLRADGTEVETELAIAPSTSESADVRFIACIREITERKRSEAQRELLVAELNHRVKNTLASVIAIGHQSFAKARSPEEGWVSFNSRLRALAQTHTRLAEAQWSRVSLRALITEEMRPFRPSGANIVLQGPYLGLDPKRAITLGMAVHELATNAAKHGALSTSEGSLEITWQVAGRQALLNWVESDGPIVRPPQHSGFGQFLLERALASELNGNVELTFAPAGLRCSIVFSLDGEAAWDDPAANVTHTEASQPRLSDAAAEARTSTEPASSATPRIMVVEDEFLLASELQSTLMSDGFVVVGPFNRVGDASEALRREAVHFAVLDTNLNGHMVYPLADELIAMGVPFAFVTGYDASNIPERFRGYPRIGKPYDQAILLSSIRSALASAKQNKPDSSPVWVTGENTKTSPGGSIEVLTIAAPQPSGTIAIGADQGISR